MKGKCLPTVTIAGEQQPGSDFGEESSVVFHMKICRGLAACPSHKPNRSTHPKLSFSELHTNELNGFLWFRLGSLGMSGGGWGVLVFKVA